jgi:homoserine dehydrogenase
VNGVEFRFSGTVGGGTPILEFVEQIGATDKIHSVKAILNGTTNYVLSRMYDVEISMEKALREAQQLGYAESDSSLDVNGTDPALKLTIIANYGLDRELTLKDIRVHGIGDISLEEVQRFKGEGKKVKLVCSIDNEVAVSREPLEASHPICVDGSLNSIQLKTKYIGDVAMIGPGAGGCQTATAILSDLLAVEERIRDRKG